MNKPPKQREMQNQPKPPLTPLWNEPPTLQEQLGRCWYGPRTPPPQKSGRVEFLVSERPSENAAMRMRGEVRDTIRRHCVIIVRRIGEAAPAVLRYLI